MVAEGFQNAAASIVGQHIGNGDLGKAREYYRVINSIAFVVIVSCVISYAVFCESYISVFTES